jgi:hypothetical protein
MRRLQVLYVAVLVLLIVIGKAQAQERSAPSLAAGSYSSGPTSRGFAPGQPFFASNSLGQSLASGEILAATPSPVITTYQAQGPVLPYSYWVSAPHPARIYVEYGATDQFPFYGRAYGSPNDRWSWYYMGGGNSRYLAKYYYPPLR